MGKGILVVAQKIHDRETTCESFCVNGDFQLCTPDVLPSLLSKKYSLCFKCSNITQQLCSEQRQRLIKGQRCVFVAQILCARLRLFSDGHGPLCSMGLNLRLTHNRLRHSMPDLLCLVSQRWMDDGSYLSVVTTTPARCRGCGQP